MSQASTPSILSETFRRKKLIIALFVLLAVESSYFVIVDVPVLLVSYYYGRFDYGCADLQSNTTHSESLIRWVSLSRPTGPALNLVAGNEITAHEPPYTLMYPIFTPPPGLLGLYLFDHGSSECPQLVGAYGPSGAYPLNNGVEVAYSESSPHLDYCALVKQSTLSIAGFNVQWHLGPSGRTVQNREILVSITNATTIRIGESVNLTMTVTNQYSFGVTLQFAKGDLFLTPSPTSDFSGFSFNPSNATLSSGGRSQR